MTYAEAFEAYQDQRDSAARGLDEITGMFKAAGWPGYGTAQGNDTPIPPQQSIPQEAGVPRKRLLDDPERLVSKYGSLSNATDRMAIGRSRARTVQLDQGGRVDDRTSRCRRREKELDGAGD